MEEKICPGCKNQCPEDDLGCGRGRAYFGSAAEHGGKREHGGHGFVSSGDEVVDLLLKCGHTLHHRRGNAEIKLDCLTDEERAELKVLLQKCLQNLE